MIYSELLLAEFEIFYNILLNHFPSKEIKEYDYLKNTFIRGLTKIITLKDNNEIVGILSYFDLGDFYFVDYFAIIESFQGSGLGADMLTYFKCSCDKPIYLEVELPNDQQSIKRIQFYQRNDLILNSIEYIIPSINGQTKELQFLLMSYPQAIEEENYHQIYQRILKIVYQKYSI